MTTQIPPRTSSASVRVERPVHWHEGMFLRPHHFQCHDRYIDSRITSLLGHSGPYRWGVADLDIDEEALKAHSLVVRSARIVTRLGRYIALPECGRVSRESFQESFEATTEPLSVWVAVPIPQSGVPTLASADHPNRPYVLSDPEEIDDENVSNARESIRFREQNVRVFVQETVPDEAAWDAVKVAEVARRSSLDPEPVLSEAYIPPLLAADAWRPLHHRLAEVAAALQAKNERVAQDIAHRPLDLRTPSGIDLSNKLAVTNELVATFPQRCLVSGVHPHDAYIELCRLVGCLSSFDSTRPQCRELALYDHGRLAFCFNDAITAAKELIDFLYRTTHDVTVFAQKSADDERHLEAKYDKAWLDRHSWNLYLGVEVGTGDPLTYDQIYEDVTRTIKLMAGSTADTRDGLALYGLELDVVRQNPPPGLPARPGMHYMRFKENESWSELSDDRYMALLWATAPNPRYTFHLFAARGDA